MAESTLPSVADFVAKELRKWFHDGEFDWSNIQQIGLAPFHPSNEAMFGPFVRPDVSIPHIPENSFPEPSLLLFNLGQDSERTTNVYKYLDQRRNQGPAALYGTSGAGKTRSVLEYLSHNKGFYLVAQRTLEVGEPGSTDLCHVFNRMISEPPALRLSCETAKDSAHNISVVMHRLITLLYIRHAIHDYISAYLKKELSALEWLLLQLYPKHYFGGDIFTYILPRCICFANIRGIFRDALDLISNSKVEWKSIVVDESQHLLKNYKEFFLSEDGKTPRSGYSALLQAFLLIIYECDQLSMPYPVFSGTGMSMIEIANEAASVVAKRFGSARETVESSEFKDFPIFDKDKVEMYMKTFLQLDNVSQSVIDHVARWLCGRPRWTATFLEEFLVRKPRPDQRTTRGVLEDDDALMIEALDRYISDMTTKDRRKSWSSGSTTAYSAVAKAMHLKDRRRMQKDLERGISRFSIGEKEHFLREDSMELIQIGVARLRLDLSKPSQNSYLAIIDEPLMVEAGIHYLGLTELVEQALIEKEHSNALGDAFEEVSLVALQSKLQGLMNEAFPNSTLSGLSTSTKSSYGVVVRSCKGQGQSAFQKLLDWIESAVLASFEGVVPPFCFPGENFGPDILTLLWNEDYTEYGTVLCQVKYKEAQSQPDALRTIVPEWLFFDNRALATRARTQNLKGIELKRWETELEAKLVGTEIPCLRCIVEYPVNATDASKTSSYIHRKSIEQCRDPDKCNKKHDWLLTIDGEESESLFSPETLGLLSALKSEPKEPKNKRQKTVTKKTSEVQ